MTRRMNDWVRWAWGWATEVYVNLEWAWLRSVGQWMTVRWEGDYLYVCCLSTLNQHKICWEAVEMRWWLYRDERIYDFLVRENRTPSQEGDYSRRLSEQTENTKYVRLVIINPKKKNHCDPGLRKARVISTSVIWKSQYTTLACMPNKWSANQASLQHYKSRLWNTNSLNAL